MQAIYIPSLQILGDASPPRDLHPWLDMDS